MSGKRAKRLRAVINQVYRGKEADVKNKVYKQLKREWSQKKLKLFEMFTPIP